MSNSNSSARHVVPWRRLIMLIVLSLALVASLLIGSIATDKNRWTPEFALDLQGGTQIILTPTTSDGSQVTDKDVAQAIEIIRQRVDASGVAEAEITSEGGKNIVVGLPGTPSKETLDLVRTAAVLRMRTLLAVTSPGTYVPQAAEATTGDDSTISEGESAAPEEVAPDAGTSEGASAEASATSAAPTPTATPTYTKEELEAAAFKAADLDGDGTLSDTPAETPTNASDQKWISEQLYYDFLRLDCTDPNAKVPGEDNPDKPIVACDAENTAKYILGPSEIAGTEVTKASSGYDQEQSLWIVNLEFNNKGGKAFGEVTTRISALESPMNQFGVVLDGRVISAPSVAQPIMNGKAMISGSFTSEEAANLANKLSFGSLPLNFEVQSEEQISATLGSESLNSGLIAGLIGLLLVVAYLIWQYHALGLVAAGSVVLATGLSYFVVSLLSWTIGYRLSLAGVVGLIISIGITADSFIVFFERIRDEIREGRSLAAATSHGWHRAKRTIIVADGVNLLCAIVLYFLAVGSVRGFAFTLGITTVLDLIIVMMFTYPVMTLLVKTKFFGEGRRFSGMNPESLGRDPIYRGRASAFTKSRGATPAHSDAETLASENGETEKAAVAVAVAEPETDESGNKLSLAQRRALQRRSEAAQASQTDGVSDDEEGEN